MNTPRQPDIAALLDELLERAVRTETRLVNLGDHFGVSLRTRQHVDVEPTPESVVVYVDALDVSLSRIQTAISESPHWAHAKPGVHMVQVRLGNRRRFSVVAEVRMLHASNGLPAHA